MYSIVSGNGGWTMATREHVKLLVIERLLGYVTLGLLLSILINRVARRS